MLTYMLLMTYIYIAYMLFFICDIYDCSVWVSARSSAHGIIGNFIIIIIIGTQTDRQKDGRTRPET